VRWRDQRNDSKEEIFLCADGVLGLPSEKHGVQMGCWGRQGGRVGEEAVPVDEGWDVGCFAWVMDS